MVIVDPPDGSLPDIEGLYFNASVFTNTIIKRRHYAFFEKLIYLMKS